MRNEHKIRIVVADDHALIRMGLIALVNTETDLTVVAEATDGQQAVDLFAKHNPDLILMDLRMPIKNGIEATMEIRKKSPRARVLMLTTFDGDEEIYQALQAGAQGYVLKGSTGENLIPALRALVAGERWIPPEVTKCLVARRGYEELTPREVEVLEQLAKGLANKEIADVLNISENTTKGHLKNITGKLRVADRTEAVTVALQRGIIHL
jgi:DNA-binding NarL/FixJ family response regulator